MIDYDNNNRIETILKQWDSWVEYYIEGGRGSWPRDAFEAMVDYYEEKIKEWAKPIHCKNCKHRTNSRWCKVLKFKVKNGYWCERFEDETVIGRTQKSNL